MNGFTPGVKPKEERKEKNVPAHPKEWIAFVATIGVNQRRVLISAHMK